MSKLKTHKGAAKRFKRTGKGGFKHKKANLQHILTKKNSNRKRKLRALSMVSDNDHASIAQMLPHGGRK